MRKYDFFVLYISDWKSRFFLKEIFINLFLKLEVNVSSEFIFNEK